MFEDTQEEEMLIYPYLIQHIEHIANMPHDLVDKLEGTEALFYNMITDKTFIDNSRLLIGAVSMFTQQLDYKIEHGVMDYSRNVPTIPLLLWSDIETFLVNIHVLTGEGEIVADNMTPLANTMVANFRGTLHEVQENKYALTTGSIHMLFDYLSIFYSCYLENIDIQEVIKILGVKY